MSNTISANISAIAAHALRWSPTVWLHSWLLYLGIQTQVRATIDPELKPLHNICEYLNALHIYADEARQGVCRSVEAYHFCSHVSKGKHIKLSHDHYRPLTDTDLRQCLIYDSCSSSARLIGVEYMVPKHVYETLDPEEQKLWHSHEFEVKSGMLILPTPSTHKGYNDKWEKLETEAMKEVIGLYGKTWHFWQVDKGHELPLGRPKLMGSLTEERQTNMEEALKDRNQRFLVDHKDKAKLRRRIEEPGIHDNADSWWKEAMQKKTGVYSW